EHVRFDEEVRAIARTGGPRTGHELPPTRPGPTLLREGPEPQNDAAPSREVAGFRARSSPPRHDAKRGAGSRPPAARACEARRLQGTAAKFRDKIPRPGTERVRTQRTERARREMARVSTQDDPPGRAARPERDGSDAPRFAAKVGQSLRHAAAAPRIC